MRRKITAIVVGLCGCGKGGDGGTAGSAAVEHAQAKPAGLQDMLLSGFALHIDAPADAHAEEVRDGDTLLGVEVKSGVAYCPRVTIQRSPGDVVDSHYEQQTRGLPTRPQFKSWVTKDLAKSRFKIHALFGSVDGGSDLVLAYYETLLDGTTFRCSFQAPPTDRELIGCGDAECTSMRR